jgi:hypothetical protein
MAEVTIRDLMQQMVVAQTRTAVALELLLLHAYNVNVHGPAPDPATIDEERFDDAQDPEALATIELMEDMGINVPDDVYEKFGLALPDRERPAAGPATPPSSPTEPELGIVDTRKKLG